MQRNYTHKSCLVFILRHEIQDKFKQTKFHLCGNGSSLAPSASAVIKEQFAKKENYISPRSRDTFREEIERNWRQTRHSLTHSVDGTEIE